ncbi:thioesterase superfamily protein-possibly 4-hydroxybenzoyl-CoA thioesterase [Nonlabens dokdonensis DSW-6]|uniref:Thioesterase superfamily protein-possibly 4-hydroxybenzoyl-CoA thioesterase n=2 Tax=Nonlabens dokdonensis TaxID=328515 RepID=L7WAP1_NONDD|nr:thioesterase superfamily protein-possibly 4-hydroxybenzoyl-CoA thioesterase [Nonlabens dokdonensis DSW-6]
MGIIHHANYLIYLEQARLEWLNQLGFSYAKMEQNDVLLPVHQIDIKYKKPIKFGDEISVRISLKKLPTTRVIFDYEIVNQNDEICSLCELTLVFTDAQKFRPIKPIPDFLEACKKLF